MAQLNNDWRLDLLFPDEYSDFVAELYYQNDFVCLLTQEKGYEQIEIEIAPKKSGENWKFKLSEFEQTLEKAKRRLWDLRETK